MVSNDNESKANKNIYFYGKALMHPTLPIVKMSITCHWLDNICNHSRGTALIIRREDYCGNRDTVIAFYSI